MANNDSTKRVPLELLCMLILKEGDRYGYEMVQEIESIAMTPSGRPTYRI